MKISSLVVSMILVSLFVTAFLTFYGGMATRYSQNLPADVNTTLAGYDELQGLQGNVSKLNQTLLNPEFSTSGFADIIGGFLGAGFTTLQLSVNSFSALYTITTNSLSAITGLSGVYIDVLLTIALVIVIFTLISVLVGVDV